MKKSVFQVYRSLVIYTKAEKQSGNVAIRPTWQPIHSDNGWVKDGVVYLNKAILEDKKFPSAKVVILMDQQEGSAQTVSHITDKVILSSNLQYNKIDFFELAFADAFELHLRCDQSMIGLPERDNYQLCLLREGSAVEVNINGKFDFSLTGRMDRTYIEQRYLWQYLGDYDRFEPTSSHTIKRPDLPERKTIDIRKPLW